LHALDDLSRKLWRAHQEGHLADAEAEAASEAVQARRAALAGEVAPNPPKEGRAGRGKSANFPLNGAFQAAVSGPARRATKLVAVRSCPDLRSPPCA
jgi:hypothetical protein